MDEEIILNRKSIFHTRNHIWISSIIPFSAHAAGALPFVYSDKRKQKHRKRTGRPLDSAFRLVSGSHSCDCVKVRRGWWGFFFGVFSPDDVGSRKATFCLARLISIQGTISDYSVATVGRGTVKVWTLRLSVSPMKWIPMLSHRPSGSTPLRSAQDDMGDVDPSSVGFAATFPRGGRLSLRCLIRLLY